MEQKKKELTIHDFISTTIVETYNENPYISSKVEKFRKQREYGARKRIKP
jgi:hypothetical protein